MLDLDQVESQFRASVKVKPVFERPSVGKVLVICDLEGEDQTKFAAHVRQYLDVLDQEQLVEWTVAGRGEIDSVQTMLAQVEAARPNLIVAYRHLFEKDQKLPHSLGTYADMLTQATSSPVLLVPPPRHTHFEKATKNTSQILVVTNHIVGDSRLVNWGLRLVEKGGALTFAHIEDDAVLRRYLEVIGKIQDLDTTVAEAKIEKQLLKEARDYLEDVCAGIAETYPDVQTNILIQRGHTVKDYEALVEQGSYDIVVFNTKDDDQQAMHGVAYSLAVELVERPLLML